MVPADSSDSPIASTDTKLNPVSGGFGSSVGGLPTGETGDAEGGSEHTFTQSLERDKNVIKYIMKI